MLPATEESAHVARSISKLATGIGNNASNLNLGLVYMPFVPRSQIEQRPNPIPPPMAVVENRVAPPSTTTITNADTEEQIAELNELLVHVLDEISSLKNAMYEKHNSRQDTKRTKKGKHRVVVEDSESESSEEEEQETDQHARVL